MAKKAKRESTKAASELTLPAEVVWIDAKQIRSFQSAVLKWFAKHLRDLPWRKTRDRYHVWISEIMLQQTQVVTVIDYWKRFVAAFPDVKALAAAEQAEVLKLWEGLGYYRRARQLQAAAIEVVEKHDGQFPSDFASVLALPGIGRYTAGAVLSIADDQPLPIVEGNTIRLYSRLMGLESDPTQTANQKLLWKFAEAIVPQENAGAFNQGLMEIGSQVCRPKDPDCPKCVLQKFCRTFETGKQAQIPAPKSRAVKYEDRHECLVLLRKNDKVLCRQSQTGERWAGLWDLVRLDLTEVIVFQQHRAQWAAVAETDRSEAIQWLQQEVADLTGLTAELNLGDWQIRHGVTRFRIQLQSVFGQNIRGRVKPNQGFVWLNLQQLTELPFNVTARKFIDQHFDQLDESTDKTKASS